MRKDMCMIERGKREKKNKQECVSGLKEKRDRKMCERMREEECKKKKKNDRKEE